MIFRWVVVSPCGPWVFTAIASVFSILYGICCWTVNELDQKEKSRSRWQRGSRPWKAHQIWLNSLGSGLGWWAFWCLLLDYEAYRDCKKPLTYIDFVLVVIAFLGMTGYLPHVSRYGSKLYPGKGAEQMTDNGEKL